MPTWKSTSLGEWVLFGLVASASRGVPRCCRYTACHVSLRKRLRRYQGIYRSDRTMLTSSSHSRTCPSMQFGRF